LGKEAALIVKGAEFGGTAGHPIAVRGLTIAKGGNIILNNVDLTIERGVFAALVGPSGCGKTSLLRALALLDQPTTGTVCLWGREYKKSDNGTGTNGKSIYPRLNYVPQTLGLWPHLTIRGNLFFAAPKSPKAHVAIRELSDRLEISANLDRKPAYVSQGQRQRAALIRALLLEPAILLLDEMTAALDGRLAAVVWDLLQTFTSNGGVIVASTHDLSLAVKCHRIYHIVERAINTEDLI
jgi:ABC-type lipoprotein export system ATPase subunit